MASYTVNPASVERARSLIDARQYVLDSDWGDVQPRAAEQNDYLSSHAWDEYAQWHLALTEGRYRRDQGEVRVRLRRLPPGAPQRADRLRLPGGRVAAQGRRARRARAPAAPGPHERLRVVYL